MSSVLSWESDRACMGLESGCTGNVCTTFVGEEAEEECSTMCTVFPMDRMRVPLSFTARPPTSSKGMSSLSDNGHRDLTSVPDAS